MAVNLLTFLALSQAACIDCSAVCLSLNQSIEGVLQSPVLQMKAMVTAW